MRSNLFNLFSSVPSAGGKGPTPDFVIIDAAGNGDYTTIEEAFADGKRRLYIKNGTYTCGIIDVNIDDDETPVYLIGESREGTKVSGYLTSVTTIPATTLTAGSFMVSVTDRTLTGTDTNFIADGFTIGMNITIDARKGVMKIMDIDDYNQVITVEEIWPINQSDVPYTSLNSIKTCQAIIENITFTTGYTLTHQTTNMYVVAAFEGIFNNCEWEAEATAINDGMGPPCKINNCCLEGEWSFYLPAGSLVQNTVMPLFPIGEQYFHCTYVNTYFRKNDTANPSSKTNILIGCYFGFDLTSSSMNSDPNLNGNNVPLLVGGSDIHGPFQQPRSTRKLDSGANVIVNTKSEINVISGIGNSIATGTEGQTMYIKMEGNAVLFGSFENFTGTTITLATAGANGGSLHLICLNEKWTVFCTNGSISFS